MDVLSPLAPPFSGAWDFYLNQVTWFSKESLSWYLKSRNTDQEKDGQVTIKPYQYWHLVLVRKKGMLKDTCSHLSMCLYLLIWVCFLFMLCIFHSTSPFGNKCHWYDETSLGIISTQEKPSLPPPIHLIPNKSIFM